MEDYESAFYECLNMITYNTFTRQFNGSYCLSAFCNSTAHDTTYIYKVVPDLVMARHDNAKLTEKNCHKPMHIMTITSFCPIGAEASYENHEQADRFMVWKISIHPMRLVYLFKGGRNKILL